MALYVDMTVRSVVSHKDVKTAVLSPPVGHDGSRGVPHPRADAQLAKALATLGLAPKWTRSVAA